MSSFKFINTNSAVTGKVGVGLSSIIGATGPQGVVGPQGWQGSNGFSTNTGAQGWQGPQGSNVWGQSGNDIYYSTGTVQVNQFLVKNSAIDQSGYQFNYNSFGSQTYTFYPTHNIQTFITPTGTTSMEIECWGAGGGTTLVGGQGGYSYSFATGLTGSNTLKLWVGDVGEGGASYDTEFIPSIVLATGGYNLTNDIPKMITTGIGYFVTGAVSEYTIATYHSVDFVWSRPDNVIRYINYLPNNEIEWVYVSSVLATGTIISTGSYPYGGYSDLYIRPNYWGSFREGQYTGDFYVVAASTGISNLNLYKSTGISGGGASYVYYKTGGNYQLLSVAGGGGSSSNWSYLDVQEKKEYIGGNSESNAPNIETTSLVVNYISYTGTIYTYIFSSGGYGNTGGLCGTGNTGTVAQNGGSGMPLVTSNVTYDVSSTGGNGSVYVVAIEDAAVPQKSHDVLSAELYSGGGGGRGYGGGGGGGIIYGFSGWGGGGGGGGNYSSIGHQYTFTSGLGTGTYATGVAGPKQPGLIKITVHGYINPAFTISPSGPITNITQTDGVSFLKDGTSFFSKGVAIGKTNPDVLLDVEGDVNAFGNIQLLNYQNIFKSNTFNPNLFEILQNNFNYSTNQPTVSLNYSLAAMSLEIGYLQNALSGLVTLLGYNNGIYDENNNLADIPYWVKQWYANYYPTSSASLSNYNIARQTSLFPTREYYLQQLQLLPFGEWCYNYFTNTYTYYLTNDLVGFYIENGKYYVYAATGVLGNTAMSIAAMNYMTNSVYSTNNPNLLNEYNSPSGSYRFNIPSDGLPSPTGTNPYTYQVVVAGYPVNVSSFVIYQGYDQGYSDNSILYYYDPTSYIIADIENLYRPYTNPLYWTNNTFYDFNNYYTGTYSSGVFIGKLRPNGIGTYSLHNPPELTITEEMRMRELNFTKNFRAAAIATKTTALSLSTSKQQTAVLKTVVSPDTKTLTFSKTTQSSSGQTSLNVNATTNFNQSGQQVNTDLQVVKGR